MWAKKNCWEDHGDGPGSGFLPGPGSRCERWHLFVKQQPGLRGCQEGSKMVLPYCGANWPHRGPFTQVRSQARQHMAAYQNYEVWLSGLLIFCFPYCLYFNSFRADRGVILLLLISSGCKCQMETQLKNTAIVRIFAIFELAAF